MGATAVAVPEDQALARPLPVLVPLIKEEISLGEEAGLEHYRRAGEMLIEAKSQVGHGDWSHWLKKNFAFTKVTAARYMKLVDVMEKYPHGNFSSLQSAVRPNEPRAAWHEPVRQTLAGVNVERLRQERQDKEKEESLVAGLKRQIIDIGYKALATKLHPDKGGSVEAMSRLNRAKSELKGAI